MNESILISDHSPVVLYLKGIVCRQRCNWRINPSLLKHLTFKQNFNSKFDEFLEINDNNAGSESMLWETLKVVMRGYIISFKSALKRVQSHRLRRHFHFLNRYIGALCPRQITARFWNWSMNIILFCISKSRNFYLKQNKNILNR